MQKTFIKDVMFPKILTNTITEKNTVAVKN